jgi:hypothetical protein
MGNTSRIFSVADTASEREYDALHNTCNTIHPPAEEDS